MAAGWFITFEGGEGSGKSTQARLLADRLSAAGRDVLSTREPGGTAFADRLRDLLLDPATPPHEPLAEALVFYAARADHLARTIRPALAAGRPVICDRFSDSTRVYQGLAGGLGLDVIDALERIVVGDLVPGLTVVVDVPPEVGLARAAERAAADAYERRDLAYHARLRAGYLEIARAEPRRCVVVEGTRKREEVARDVWAAVTQRFGVP
jgi:dTMP kinase